MSKNTYLAFERPDPQAWTVLATHCYDVAYVAQPARSMYAGRLLPLDQKCKSVPARVCAWHARIVCTSSYAPPECCLHMCLCVTRKWACCGTRPLLQHTRGSVQAQWVGIPVFWVAPLAAPHVETVLLVSQVDWWARTTNHTHITWGVMLLSGDGVKSPRVVVLRAFHPSACFPRGAEFAVCSGCA